MNLETIATTMKLTLFLNCCTNSFLTSRRVSSVLLSDQHNVDTADLCRQNTLMDQTNKSDNSSTVVGTISYCRNWGIDRQTIPNSYILLKQTFLCSGRSIINPDPTIMELRIVTKTINKHSWLFVKIKEYSYISTLTSFYTVGIWVTWFKYTKIICSKCQTRTIKIRK